MTEGKEKFRMNFELTEEMRMLKEMAYKFAVAEIAPFSAECDEQEKYLPEIRKKAAENGLVGAWIPEAYGGSGAGILGNAIITEELSKIDMGIGLNIVASGFGCESILNYGRAEEDLSAADLRRRPGLRRRLYRTQRGNGCLGLQDAGRQGWKRLCDQRQQNVHHQRHRVRFHGCAMHHQPRTKEAQQF